MARRRLRSVNPVAAPEPADARSEPAPTPGPTPVRHGAGRGNGRGTALAAAWFIALAAVLSAWVWAADAFFGHSKEHLHASFPGSSWLTGWVQFDAGWYRDIAEHGYRLIGGEQSNVAFFPLYPLLIRALHQTFGSSFGAGIAITVTCGLLAVMLFWRWCGERLDPPAQKLALALLLLYPYAWYLCGAVYADALFLATTLAAFTALERDRTLLAGIFGALAAATRPVGPAVVIALVVRQIERRGALRTTTRTWRGRTWELPVGIDWRKLQPSDAFVLLSAAGFCVYSGYLWWRWGDPLLFSTVQRYWKQPSGPVTWLKLHLAGIIVLKFKERWLYIIGCLVQGALAMGSLLLVPRIRRSFGWGYATLVAVSLAIPVLGSKDFQGLGRYLLAAFPLFAWGGLWLAGKPVRTRRCVLIACGLLLLAWSHLYGRGYYVA